MRRTMTFAIATLAFAAAPLATIPPPAAAQGVSVTINPDIAFGYSDGYWDRNHQWHKWRNHEESEGWRRQNADHYYDRQHDREKDAGWRGSDQWWAHH
jgi:hypothetical protein